MPLPKIDVPIYDLKLHSSGKDIRYRPFLVKEEKILFMAMEGNDPVEQVLAMKQIIRNCVLDEDLNIDDLPLYELEHILLKLRSKSVNNLAEVMFNCQQENCNGKIPVQINLDKVYVSTNETHTKTIQLTDQIGLIMKYPGLETMVKIQNTEDTMENMLMMVESCVECVYDSEETYKLEDYSKEDKRDFFDSLTQTQFLEVRNFFDTIPKLQYTSETRCPDCGHEGQTVVEGMENFFG